jgi:hypothetical protein
MPIGTLKATGGIKEAEFYQNQFFYCLVKPVYQVPIHHASYIEIDNDGWNGRSTLSFFERLSLAHNGRKFFNAQHCLSGVLASWAGKRVLGHILSPCQAAPA